jgi:hypothetical protein
MENYPAGGTHGVIYDANAVMHKLIQDGIKNRTLLTPQPMKISIQIKKTRQHGKTSSHFYNSRGEL